MSEAPRSVHGMDDIEGSWDRPLTGREVGPWCVDLIEEIVENHEKPTERHAALLKRSGSVGDAEEVAFIMARIAALIIGDLRLFVGMNELDVPNKIEADEALRRSLLGAKAALTGTPRNPFLDSSEG